MATPADSNALVPSNQGGTNFAQQGSLDWVALGRMQYSTSVAILARLSKAGIDPLTIAVGQAMCHRLPIGPHGEKVLSESMTKLTARSIAADLIWFGIGVRHVLRDLVQTSQGCSLVALCAALTEAHTVSVSALIIYEMAKLCGGPDELLPSLQQWEALVRTAAPIFGNTTFGLRISQISKFAKQPLTTPVPHPTDTAMLLFKLGEITHGSLQSISVRGDRGCSWIAAWAEYVLGLRVLIRNAEGDIVYANHDMGKSYAQVQIDFVSNENSKRVLITRSNYLLRPGEEFVRRCFRNTIPDYSVGDHVAFFSGRIRFDTMLFDVFGDQARALLGSRDYEVLPLAKIRRKEFFTDEQRELRVLNQTQIFSRMLAITLIVATARDPRLMSGSSAVECFIRACDNVPELRYCGQQTIGAIEGFLEVYGTVDAMLNEADDFEEPAIERLRNEYHDYARLLHPCSSECKRMHWSASHTLFSKQFNRYTCIPTLAFMICEMVLSLDRLVFDTPLQPSVSGLFTQYRRSLSDDRHRKGLRRYPDSAYYNVVDVSIATLFSAGPWNTESNNAVAQSDGKIYCYTHLLEGLTDNMREACKIHIGWGHIEHRNRFHAYIFDGAIESIGSFGYPARALRIIDNLGDVLQLDTTSQSIGAQLMIDEGPTDIGLFHHITTDLGSTVILSTGFLKCLWNANKYKAAMRVPKAAQEKWERSLQGRNYVVVQGEGAMDGLLSTRTTPSHIVRPLKGNVLGRCVAISQAVVGDGTRCLVRTDEELELFARYVASVNEHGPRPSFTLIT